MVACLANAPALRKHVSCLRLERLVDTEQAFLHFIPRRGIKNSAAFGLPSLISNAWCTAPRNPRIRLLPPTAQAQNPIAHNYLWLIHKTLPLVLSRLRDLPPVQLSSLAPLLWLVRASGSCFSLNTAKELRPPQPPLAQERFSGNQTPLARPAVSGIDCCQLRRYEADERH